MAALPVLLEAYGDPAPVAADGEGAAALMGRTGGSGLGGRRGQLKLTKRGPSLARFYLYCAALRLIAHEPVVKQWYQRKTSRPGAVKNKVVIALMRKLGPAVWQLARGSSFDVNKLFDLEAVADV